MKVHFVWLQNCKNFTLGLKSCNVKTVTRKGAIKNNRLQNCMVKMTNYMVSNGFYKEHNTKSVRGSKLLFYASKIFSATYSCSDFSVHIVNIFPWNEVSLKFTRGVVSRPMAESF